MMQMHSKEEFVVPVEGEVVKLIFDPDRHLLQTHLVRQDQPAEYAGSQALSLSPKDLLKKN